MANDYSKLIPQLEEIIKEKGYVDISYEMNKSKQSSWYMNTEAHAEVYFKMLDNDRYEGFEKGTHFYIIKDKNYALNQSLLLTNESVRKVNKLFWATIVLSVLSFLISLIGLLKDIYEPPKKIEVILKQQSPKEEKTNPVPKIISPSLKQGTLNPKAENKQTSTDTTSN